MPSPETLSQWSVYAGVTATVLGAGAVAPEATRAALVVEPKSLAIAIWRRLRAVARAVARFFWYRVLRRPQVIAGGARIVGLGDVIGVSDVLTVKVTRTPPESDLDARIAWSEAQILGLWHHVEGLEVTQQQALEQLRSSLIGRDLELSRQVGAIERQVKDAESMSVHLNSRAFPVIALGAILSGLPGMISRSLWVFLPAVVVTALYTFGAVNVAWGSQLRRLLRRG